MNVSYPSNHFSWGGGVTLLSHTYIVSQNFAFCICPKKWKLKAVIWTYKQYFTMGSFASLWPHGQKKFRLASKQLFFLAKAQGQAKLVKNTKVIGNAVTLKNLDPLRSHVSYSIHTSFFFFKWPAPLSWESDKDREVTKASKTTCTIHALKNNNI